MSHTLSSCTRGLIAAVLTLAGAAVGAAPTLVRTLDLRSFAGTPVSPWIPPLPPAPRSDFSLTSLAFDPVQARLYVADSATANVYLIDARSGSIVAAANTQGVTTAAANPTAFQPITVLANPSSGRWIAASPLYGGRFLGTGFAPTDGVPSGSLPAGAVWDPFTDIVYAGRTNLFATLNLKYLYGGFPCAGTTNMATLNVATSRVYASCGQSDSPAALVMFDGVAMQKADKKAPQPSIGAIFPGRRQGTTLGLAVNPSTNRLYAMSLSAPGQLDVFDASTYQRLAAVAGLPDQSTSAISSSTIGTPLPQPVAVNTRTNTVFVLSPIDSSVAVIDGATHSLVARIEVPASPWQEAPAGEPRIGNTIVDGQLGLRRTLGGASAIAVDEAANLLHVATVDGLVLTYALDAPAVAPTFSISGTVVNAAGGPLASVNVTATGAAGSAAGFTDAQGLFVLTGLPSGSYSVAPVGITGYPPVSATLADQNATRLRLAPSSKSFTVSVGRSNPGTVTASPTGVDRALDCGNACAAKFSAGTSVVLTATPPAGKSFVNWSGACSGTAPSCTIVVNSDLSVQAVFSK